MSGVIRFIHNWAWAPTAGPRPTHGLLNLRRETIVPAPLEQTFAFFSAAANLERLTPPSLHFEIRTAAPIVMREGLIIDYRLDLHGWPIPWRSRIDIWEPGVRFVDRQLVGPYRWWRHEHRFETVPGGTRVIDHVEFLPRAAWLTARLVEREVSAIFAYRQAQLAMLLGVTAVH